MQSDHLQILESMKNLYFNVGKTTLVSFLIGDLNPTIERNRLDEHNNFGCLYKLKKGHIYALLGDLEKDNLIAFKFTSGGFKTLRITPKGRAELMTPTKNYSNTREEKIEIKKVETNLKESNLSHLDSILPQFSFFTENLNYKQQLAVLDPHNSILCVAGAGSGKTTVLIKRIEFLVRFKGVKPENILAITFTTKARDEMRNRLESIGLSSINIHTFNSFCEQQLRKIQEEHPNLVKTSKVLTFSNKIQIIRGIMNEHKLQFEYISREYFSSRQRKEKSNDELFLLFCYEIFSILDYSKNTNQDISQYSKTAPQSIKHVASQIELILNKIQIQMSNLQIRDFTDQILQTQEIYNKNVSLIPNFEHVLVDEYQDINAMQLDLIKQFKSNNIFCVGDPRQSIYNWRGSDISFILDFEKYYEKSHIIMLELNYRSNTSLVNLGNEIIKPLQLNDLKTPVENLQEDSIQIVECRTQKDEYLIALSQIKGAIKIGIEPNEIFVLSRTNRSLEDFSKTLLTQGVKFNLKSDEFSTKRQDPLNKSQIILATIHAIKGQEAKIVIIIDTTTQYFPNKVQDNEFIAHVKSISSYDKFQEELRLFYVACTRAKEKLLILYSGSLTSFVPKSYVESNSQSSQKKLQNFLFNSRNQEVEKKNVKVPISSSNSDSKDSKLLELKQFRLELSNRLGIQTHEIMSNHQLNQCISLKPQSIVELEQILFPNTFVCKKYGDKILNILN